MNSTNTQPRNLPDEFNFELTVLRQRMTYQLLLDLKTIEDTGRSSQLQPKIIQQRQQIIVRIYEKHINQLKNIQQSAEMKIKQQELQMDLSLVQNLKKFNQECDIPATIELFQKLISRQQQVIEIIEKYMNVLTERIQHEKYVQEQQGICQHLKKQIHVFRTKKNEMREILESAKAQRKQWYDVALGVCQDKQAEIEQLSTIKSHHQVEIQKQKQYTFELSRKQTELYREISKLALELNTTNSLKSTKSEHIKGEKQTVDATNQKEFRQRNFGSAIQSRPTAEMENPSLIFSSHNSDDADSTQTPTCFVQSGIDKEFEKRKFAILTLFLLSILVWFV